jgi:hypothetical protein
MGLLRLKYKKVIGCTTPLTIDFPIAKLEVWNRTEIDSPLNITFQNGDIDNECSFVLQSNEQFSEVVPMGGVTNSNADDNKILIGVAGVLLYDYAYWY